jgi:hypothetical protein
MDVHTYLCKAEMAFILCEEQNTDIYADVGCPRGKVLTTWFAPRAEVGPKG